MIVCVRQANEKGADVWMWWMWIAAALLWCLILKFRKLGKGLKIDD